MAKEKKTADALFEPKAESTPVVAEVKKEEVAFSPRKSEETAPKKEVSYITAEQYCSKRGLSQNLAKGINQVEKIKDKPIEEWDAVFAKFMRWNGKDWEAFKNA